jgi:hypothetical protein
MLGAIFCRTCGAKLELDQLRPDDIKEKPPSIAKKIGDIVSRICILLIAAALIGLLVALFLPVPDRVLGQVETQDMRRLQSIVKRLKAPTRKNHSFILTSEEVTVMANWVLGLTTPPSIEETGAQGGQTGQPVAEPEPSPAPPPKPATAGLVPEHLSVALLTDGDVRLVLRSMLFGKLPVYSALLGRLEVVDGNASFTPRIAKMGKIKIVGKLDRLIVERFKVLLDRQPELTEILNNLKSVEISDGNAVVVCNLPGTR